MDLKKIIKENKKHVDSIIKLITKEENDDLSQEVFVKVWENTNKYEEKGTLKNWIAIIAKNLSKDYLKSANHKVQIHSTSNDTVINSIKDSRETPENQLTKKIRQKKITNAINSLKPKLKEVILLTEFEGYSYEECAKKLKCPLGTIKSRIFNAKKELAIKLEDLL